MASMLVTGATDGLGRGLAAALAARGDEVIVHGRSRERTGAVAREIGAAGALVADFGSLDAVRRMAEEAPPVDVLVNNAGVIVPERRLSADGNELTFQVNHLAGFLLATRLLPPRIVNVASVGQHPLDFGDLTLERGYDAFDAYARSKLAQVLFTFELAERRPDLRVNALHPATLMDTKLAKAAFSRTMSTVEEGIEATIALIDRDDVTGRYFEGKEESRAAPQAYDAEARRRLWDASERLIA